MRTVAIRTVSKLAIAVWTIAMRAVTKLTISTAAFAIFTIAAWVSVKATIFTAWRVSVIFATLLAMCMTLV